MSKIEISGEVVITEKQVLYVARLSGLLAPGSKDSGKITNCSKILEKELQKTEQKISTLILDCSGLEYTYGDSLASFFMLPMLQGISSCVVIAIGETREALEKLIQFSSIPIPIVESLEEAIKLGGYAFWDQSLSDTMEVSIPEIELAKGITCTKLVEGTILNDCYHLSKEIGQGKIGIVYLAKDKSSRTEKTVAIKLLPKQLQQAPTTIQEIEQKFITSSRLIHPNIGVMYEFVEDKRANECFLVLEHIVGKSLSRKMRKKGIYRLKEILPIMEQVMRGLHFAHTNDVSHLNIKPNNIMILPSKKVRILDFGQAQIKAHITKEFISAYTAPEQIEPKGEKNGPQTDVWAMAIIMYEMLSGQPPFKGDKTSELAQNILQTPAKNIDKLPENVWKIMQKALHKKASERFSDISIFWQEIQKAYNNSIWKKISEKTEEVEQEQEQDSKIKNVVEEKLPLPILPGDFFVKGKKIKDFDFNPKWKLEFRGYSDLLDQELEELTSIASNIRGIDLQQSQISDDGVKFLGKMPNLKRLILDKNPITEVGIEHISKLPKLIYLSVCNCTEITKFHSFLTLQELYLEYCEKLEDFSNIPKISTLSKLEASSTLFDNLALNLLWEIPNLHELRINFTMVTDTGFKIMPRYRKLKKIAFRGCENITDVGFRHLSKVYNLKKIEINKNISEAVIETMKQDLPEVEIGIY